jgi:hypothetical protein
MNRSRANQYVETSEGLDGPVDGVAYECGLAGITEKANSFEPIIRELLRDDECVVRVTDYGNVGSSFGKQPGRGQANARTPPKYKGRSALELALHWSKLHLYSLRH